MVTSAIATASLAASADSTTTLFAPFVPAAISASAAATPTVAAATVATSAVTTATELAARRTPGLTIHNEPIRIRDRGATFSTCICMATTEYRTGPTHVYALRSAARLNMRV
jgi:hypothetical protein